MTGVGRAIRHLCAVFVTLAFSVSFGTAMATAPLRARMVSDTDTETAPYSSQPTGFTAIAGNVYFSAYTPELGFELYVTDGTAAGAHLVADIQPGPSSSQPKNFAAFGNLLLFAADDGRFGVQIWTFAPGTQTLKKLTSLPAAIFGGVPAPVAALPNGFLFQDGDKRPWISDGTPAGTHLLALPQQSIYLDGSAKVLGNKIVFAADNNGTNKRHIFATDGIGNAVQLDTSVPATDQFEAHPTIVCDGTYFLFSNSSANYTTLVRSDGTPTGTHVLLDPLSGKAPSSNNIACLAGKTYFFASSGSPARPTLWQSDGTQEGTSPVISFGNADIPGSSYLDTLGTHLTFFAPYFNGTFNEIHPWISNGTAAGTRMLPMPSDGSSTYSSSARRVGNAIALISDPSYQHQPRILWTYDENSSAPVLAINPFPFTTESLQVIGNQLYGAGTDEFGDEPWESDLTVAHTHRIADVWAGTYSGLNFSAPLQLSDSAVQQDIVYFGQAKVGHYDSEASNTNTLWRSDGTATGTEAVDIGSYDGAVKGVVAIPGGVIFVTQGIDDPSTHIYGLDSDSDSAHLISSTSAFPYLQTGGKAIFGCGNYNEMHLCASGVQAGSALDITPAATQFNQLSEIGAINGGAVTALVQASGQPELWRSDGTAPGTYFLAPLSNNPFGFTLSNVIGNELYFVGCKLQEGCAFYATSGAPGSVREVAPGILPRGKLQKIGSRLLFGTGVSQGNEQLWSTDGTAAGTTLLLDFGDSYGIYGVSQSGLGHIVLWNDGAAAYWTTDGTVAGTQLVQNSLPFTPMQNEIWPGPDFDSVLFQCYRPDSGPELCTADGSIGSPHILADIYPGENGSYPQYINRTSRGVFFSADDGHHGRELWIVEALPETIFASGFEP